MIDEIWKDVKGYEGLYQVSNLGRVKSFRESSKFGNPKEFYLKPTMINSGYHTVTLYLKDRTRRKFQVHRLVAETFIPNPENLPCVNHKDENKLNNIVSNLEWCTYQYNNNYGTAKKRAIDTKSKPIYQKTLDGVLIAKYRSASIASDLLKYPKHIIPLWCRAGIGDGYIWGYDDERMD